MQTMNALLITKHNKHIPTDISDRVWKCTCNIHAMCFFNHHLWKLRD